MLVRGVVADAFDTNCYVVATGPGEQCVVVDPGIGVLTQLDAVLAEHRLRPAAVLLTHGHLDHTFSVAPVCGARGITAYVHPDDREMLADPAKGLSMTSTQLFGGRLAVHRARGRRAELPDGGTITVAGLEITVDHAPGPHRRFGAVPAARRRIAARGRASCACPATCSSPARSAAPTCRAVAWTTMLLSLRDKILPLDDATVVLPGHGPATTIGRERRDQPVPARGRRADGRAGVARIAWLVALTAVVRQAS